MWLPEGGGGAERSRADPADGGCLAGAAENFACAYGDSGVGRSFDSVLPGMDPGGAHAGRADHPGCRDEIQWRRKEDSVAAGFGGNVFDSCRRTGGSEHDGGGFGFSALWSGLGIFGGCFGDRLTRRTELESGAALSEGPASQGDYFRAKLAAACRLENG